MTLVSESQHWKPLTWPYPTVICPLRYSRKISLGMSSNLPTWCAATTLVRRKSCTSGSLSSSQAAVPTLLLADALRDGRSGRGPGPSALERLLLAGHAGVSTDAGAAIFGFTPDAGGLAAWQVVYGLRNGDAFPGIVTDDTDVFTAARQHDLAVEAFDVLLP
jgi:hypothetical protein